MMIALDGSRDVPDVEKWFRQARIILNRNLRLLLVRKHRYASTVLIRLKDYLIIYVIADNAQKKK